jgi:hypothetical protein
VVNEPTDARPNRATTRSGELEDRAVKVSEPGLSDEANGLLTREVREVIGRDHVLVPHDRPHSSQNEVPRGSRLLTALHDNRLIVGITGGAALVIGAVLALLIGGWWVLPLAAVVLLLATYGVVSVIYSVESESEEPSATTVALLEEEGVRNPERLFADVLEEFTEDGSAD